MLSQELVRRLVLVDMDARVVNPELRTGFRHNDIRGWATENRGKLVWACLTLIQHWIASGKPLQNDVVLASYENWSRIIGGILKAAGINKFMANRATLVEKSTDSDADDLMELLDKWWEQYENKIVYIKSEGTDIGLDTIIQSFDIMLGIPRTRNADGESVYSPKQIGKYLSKYKDRMFQLSNEKQVRLVRYDKRTGRGST